MKFRKAVARVLAGVCLISWANPGFALRQPQPAGTATGLEELTDALTGLEEDPLLEIWQRNKAQPAHRDPLERPRLLKEWDRFWPWVKKHLEDPDSPIPHWLLWDMLLSENWERKMEEKNPPQWVWLADQLLPHWEGGVDSSKGGQRGQELKLLAALDRLALRDVPADALDPLHHRILSVWHQEFSRGDPHWLSEELTVSLLKSLERIAGFPPRRRESLWPRAKIQETFQWIQKAWAQERRPSLWEASHLTPEHLPLLEDLPRDQVVALFESVLPKLLYRSPAGYNSMGEISEAASFVGLWMAAAGRPALKGAFLAGLAKSLVEKILDPLLEIAADYPELRTPILRFLAVLLNLKGWFFTDQDLPWVNLIYLMNQIETQEQHLWMQEVNRLLLKGYSGRIGVPRSSPLRPLTRPLEDPDSFGPDLNGFIRREAHHVGGAHVLDLALLRLHWWATGDKTPLVEYLKQLHTAEARNTLSWLADRETAPEAEELRPALQQVLGNRAVDFLVTAEESDLKSVRENLREKDAQGLDRLFDREIPLVRLLGQMYAPRSAEAALEAIQSMHRNQQGTMGWPGEKLDRFLTAFRGEDRLAALQALAELHSAVRQEILQPSRYPKWGTSHHEFYQREYDSTSEVHHGIPAVRGYDPRDLNFQLYILLEYVRPLAGQWAGQLIRQAQQEPGGPDQANLLKGFLQWLKATGPGSQQLEDLLELAGSENLPPARLQWIGNRLLATLDQMAARQDKQIGETIDAVASVLKEEKLNPEILEGMGLKTLPAGRIWEPRLRSHLGRQILAHRQAAAAARTFATLLKNLLGPIQTGSGESQKGPEGWVSLTAPIEGSGGLEHLGNKFRNLMLLHQWGHPVPPAVGFPIGKEAQGVVRRMKEGVARVEDQIRDRDLQTALGARFADPENPLLLSVRSGALVDLPGQLATLENVGIHLNLLPALEKRIGSWAAWDAYRRFVQDFAVSVYGSRYGFTPELFDRIIEGYKQEAGVEKKIQLSAEQMKEIALEYDKAVQFRVLGGIPEDPWEQLARAIQAVVDSWEQPRVQPILEIFGLAHEKGTAVILQAMIYGNFSREVDGAEGHERSGAGVAFVPSDSGFSEGDVVGSFGQGAQGSDIADGVIIPEPLSRLEELMPDVFKELQEWARDIQEKSGEGNEIEFTVQNGRLWILQNRFVPIRGKASEFRRETVGASVPLGRGEGLAGGAVRGILVFPKSLEDPVRLDQLNRLAAESGVDGILLAMDTATPEDTRFLRMRGVQGFLAHRGGKGQHEGMIATLLGLTAVAGLSGMELDRDNPAGGVYFHADPLKKDPGVHVKEGDLVSVDGFRGAVYPGKLPLATEPSDAPSAGPSTSLRTGLEEAPRIVVADKMDETQLGVPGVINVSTLAKDQKREAVIAADPHILIVRSDFQLDAELMSRLSHLRKVIRGGHGLDNVDLPYAASKNIEVRGTGGAELSVTAWTVQAIGRAQAIRLNAAPAGPAQVSYPLGFARSDWEAAQKEKAAKEPPDSQPMLEQKFNALFQPVPTPAWDALRGKTVGIIGFGRIGKTIASTAHDLGMNVLAYAPSLEADPGPAQALGARFATKEKIYRSAHYIVLITGLYKEGPRRNVGMVDKAAVDLMLANENLIALIDPDRKRLVVEPEIADLVMAGVQYFLDDLPENPTLRENAQFTPHIGASTPQAKRQVITETAAILQEFVDELNAQAGLEEPPKGEAVPAPLTWAFPQKVIPVSGQDVLGLQLEADGSIALARATGTVDILNEAGEKIEGGAIFTEQLDWGTFFLGPGRLFARWYQGKVGLWKLTAPSSTPTKPLYFDLPSSGRGFSRVEQKLGLSPDGETVAYVGGNHEIHRVSASGEIGVLRGHTREVQLITFSSDGKLLASANTGGELIIWDLEREQILRHFTADQFRFVQSLAFSPDSRSLATVHYGGHIGGVVRVIPDVRATGDPQIREFVMEDKGILRALYSREGELLVASPHAVYALNPADGRILFMLAGKSKDPMMLSLHPTKDLLATMEKDWTESRVLLWDLEEIRRLAAIKARVRSPEEDPALRSSLDLLRDVRKGDPAHLDQRLDAATTLHELGFLVPAELSELYGKLLSMGSRQAAVLASYRVRIGAMSVEDLRREMEQWIAWDEAARAANGEDHLIALELRTAVPNDETGRRLQRLLELAMRVPGNLQYGRLRVETIFEDGGLEIQTLPSYSYEIQARIWELWEEITDAEGLDFNLTPSGRSDAWLHVNFNGRLEGELTQAFLYRAVAAQAEFAKSAQMSLRPEVPPGGYYYPLRVRDPRESKLSQGFRTELTLMIHAATAEMPNPWVPFLDRQALRDYRWSLLREIDAVVSAYRRRNQEPERWLREITDLPQANLHESAVLRNNRWASYYAEEIRGAQRFYDQRTETADGREELARLRADFEAKGFALEWEESFEIDPSLWKPLGLPLLNNHDLAGLLLAKRRWSWGAELQVEGQRARLVAPPAGPTPHETYSVFVDRYLRPRVEGHGFIAILFQRDGIYGLSSTGWPHLIDKLFMPEGLGGFFADRGGNFTLGLMLPQRGRDHWWDELKLLLDPRNLRRIDAAGSWGSPDQPVHPRFGERSLDLSGYVAKTIQEPGTDRKIPASYIVTAAGLEEIYQALEGLSGLEYVWKGRPASVASSARPILLDATDEEGVRHLAQALAIFMGRDNRADGVLDFRLVVPEVLRERTMNELARVNLFAANNFLENRLISYDGTSKNREQARQEALRALVLDAPIGQTPEQFSRRGDLLLVESVGQSWVLELSRYLAPAGLRMLDDAARGLEVLQEAA